ncbi:MAG TPA: TIGR02281 family clan AA aspartic protease [Caulobacteraceae bacterium]|jgi:aspartyl protease family protein
MVRFLVIGLFAALAAVGAADSLTQMSLRQAQKPPAAAAVATFAPTPQPVQPPSLGDGEASIAKSADGHFWADAQVDGRPVRFLVDTGASDVALTADDARALGFAPETLTYSYTVMTANGPARAAPIKLGIVSVGRAEVEDVDAFVIDKGLETSLLGMTYLGRLAKFEATPDSLVLKS